MFLLCEESPEPSAYKKCNVSRFHISSPGTLSGATLRGLRTTVQAAAGVFGLVQLQKLMTDTLDQ